MTNLPLRFDYIPYPLWRKDVPAPLRPIADSFYRRIYPVDTDRVSPRTTDDMARYLVRWGLMDVSDVRRLADMKPNIETARRPLPRVTDSGKIRLPAQWETLEAVILNFPVIYPPLWEMFAQMVEAITPVADVQITIPGEGWACGIALYLEKRGKTNLEHVRFLTLPADDIWVRDYGPFMGMREDGEKSVISATFATHPRYPQANDDAMVERYAAYRDLILREMPLNTEGGNFLTDGQGTLIMSTKVLESNPHLTPQTLESLLHDYFQFQKLILTPRLTFETTGHVDMLVKLIDPETLIISAPNTRSTRQRLQATIDLFKQETNAKGQKYKITLIPTLPLYYNWFFYPIRRSYTNALTVNGRILVPIYGVKEDAEALAIYRRVASDFEIMPIDCRVGANGGGAVHCMTKEVPQL